MCAGSFLNVCIYRIPLEKSIVFPASFCPNCGTPLKARDMIPVISYAALKGKCRTCGQKISVQYPLVELTTGILWVLVYRRYGISAEAAALIFLFSVLIPVALIDLKCMIIPDGLVLTGLAGGAAVFVYHTFFRPFRLFDSDRWYAPLIGMISASGILFLIALIGLLIYKDDSAMGMGDVKIFLPIGLFFGWRLSVLTLFLAVILAGTVGIVLLLFHVLNRKSTIPFGPFIVIASFIVGLYGGGIPR